MEEKGKKEAGRGYKGGERIYKKGKRVWTGRRKWKFKRGKDYDRRGGKEGINKGKRCHRRKREDS